MYLERILGSKAKIRMLNVLVGGNSFIESKLAQKAGLSAPEVRRQIVDLVGTGLVRMNKVGRSKEYSINKKYFLVKPLEKVFISLSDVYLKAAKNVTRALVKNYAVECVLLVGSVAEKTATLESDIDLIVVLPTSKRIKDVQESMILRINQKISNKYGFICNPIVISREEYLRRLDKDYFIIKVHANGVVLYGKKPRKYG